MEIIIGKQGNQPFPLTENSVSRQHAVFRYDKQSGRMTLTDTRSTNGTWLLGNDGVFHRITAETAVTPQTLVRVGAKTTFHIKDLLVQPKEPEEAVDIAPLRHVFERYQMRKIELENSNSNLMMLRMAVVTVGGLIGTLAAVLLPEDFLGDPMVGNVVKVVVTLVLVVIGLLAVSHRGHTVLERRSMNDHYFHKHYCCPKCGYHFGLKLYDNVLAEGCCPNRNCKVKFVEKKQGA